MTLTLEMLLTIVGALVPVAALAWGLVSWVIAQFASRDVEIANLGKDLAGHKLHAAETYATTHELTTALGRVETSIERLNDRLDRFLDPSKITT